MKYFYKIVASSNQIKKLSKKAVFEVFDKKAQLFLLNVLKNIVKLCKMHTVGLSYCPKPMTVS